MLWAICVCVCVLSPVVKISVGAQIHRTRRIQIYIYSVQTHTFIDGVDPGSYWRERKTFFFYFKYNCPLNFHRARTNRYAYLHVYCPLAGNRISERIIVVIIVSLHACLFEIPNVTHKITKHKFVRFTADTIFYFYRFVLIVGGIVGLYDESRFHTIAKPLKLAMLTLIDTDSTESVPTVHGTLCLNMYTYLNVT